MSDVSRRRFLATGTAVAGGALGAGALLGTGTARAAAAAPRSLSAGFAPAKASSATAATAVPNANRHAHYRVFDSAAAFRSGTASGVKVTADGLEFARSQGTVSYTDTYTDDNDKTTAVTRTYDWASWTSPVIKPGFDLTQLVSSWNADTPAGTWVESSMQGRTTKGTWTKWWILGRWTRGDDFTTDIHRACLDGQEDADGTVAEDTYEAPDGLALTEYRLKISFFRPTDTTTAPTVHTFGAVSSAMPAKTKLAASPIGRAAGRVLDVPAYSQDVHDGEYPQYDGGGEDWCSATSTAMVVDYWKVGPTAAELAGVQAKQDPQVDYAARYVYDYGEDACGNWPFNCAYANSRGLRTFVTRLRSLTEAEEFIRAGIPLITSLAFKKSELHGAGYGTDGHLMVLCGFTRAGDPIMNDPAAHGIADDAQVRTSYDRGEFENAWLQTSFGTVYVYTPQGYKLPAVLDRSEPNW